MRIVISSGHGKYVRGASGAPVPPQLDEVDEARKVVEGVAKNLRNMGVEVTTLHDDVSRNQSDNLNWIVNQHNKLTRDYDVSIHFNAYGGGANGHEVDYLTQKSLAQRIAGKVCTVSGLKKRGENGAVYRDGLKFLNATEMPAVLIETCFCDYTPDCDKYRASFDVICSAIAEGLSGQSAEAPDRPERPEWPELPSGALFSASGTCSTFGGPEDEGVSPSEGLAFIYEVEQVPHLFLPYQPSGTTGLARRLNPYVHYIACRWDYRVTPKTMLSDSGQVALVRAKKTGIELTAIPSDWGPHEEQTGRAADLSPSLMQDLGITTDDEVEVIYPWES